MYVKLSLFIAEFETQLRIARFQNVSVEEYWQMSQGVHGVPAPD